MTDCKDTASKDTASKYTADSVGDRIVYLRQALGLTQAEFARKLGYSAGYVSRWEHGLIYSKKNGLDKQNRSNTEHASNTQDESYNQYGTYDQYGTYKNFLIKVCKTFGTDLKWLIGESDELPEVIRDARNASNEVDMRSIAWRTFEAGAHR